MFWLDVSHAACALFSFWFPLACYTAVFGILPHTKIIKLKKKLFTFYLFKHLILSHPDLQ